MESWTDRPGGWSERGPRDNKVCVRSGGAVSGMSGIRQTGSDRAAEPDRGSLTRNLVERFIG